jgi:hypothetical protein
MKIAIPTKVIYIMKSIAVKIPMAFFADIEKAILEFIWKHRMTLDMSLKPKFYSTSRF